MWWRRRDKSEKPLRQQLVEACDSVRRQIDAQETTPQYQAAGSNDPSSGKQTALRELRAELEQLEGALEKLGPTDA
jgi:hypothetical protein